MMTLLEMTEKLGQLDREHTIYAAKPWTPESLAVVAEEPQRGGRPPEAVERGLAYFLEVAIARDFLTDWQASLRQKVSLRECCQRLIGYATNDA
jgi:hypothetical protein